MVAQQSQGDTVGQLAMAVDQFGVGVDIAVLGTPDEVGVTDVFSHRHSLVHSPSVRAGVPWPGIGK
jgi:hypothetical protein